MNCYLGLGSNLGDKQNYINRTIECISILSGVKFLRSSKLITTKPYGKTDQPDFLNCVIEIETSLKPAELLRECLEIEAQLGRIRKEKWGPRTIDIDLLFYEDRIINSKSLVIPHPDLHKRQFVLASLNELCPEYVHPIMQRKIKDIFMELT